MLENILAFFKDFPQFNNALAAGLLVFARFLAFAWFAPVLGRKDIPVFIKVSFSVILTCIFMNIQHFPHTPKDMSLLLGITLNMTFGVIIGYIASCIFDVVAAAGDMINMQMGLSAAQLMDPSSKEQSSIMGNLFKYIGTIIFMNIGGVQWLISAFHRGFDVFPLYATSIPLDKIVNMNYLIEITSNVLFIGLQLAAPVLIATMAMDIILGVISKIAPQINVFQLSFLFKPVLGMAVIISLLPLLVNVITDHFLGYAQIF